MGRRYRKTTRTRTYGAVGGAGQPGGYKVPLHRRAEWEAIRLHPDCVTCGGRVRVLPRKDGPFLVPGSDALRCEDCGEEVNGG